MIKLTSANVEQITQKVLTDAKGITLQGKKGVDGVDFGNNSDTKKWRELVANRLKRLVEQPEQDVFIHVE